MFDRLISFFAPRLVGKDKDNLTILVEGKELVVESASVIRTMDTAADGWKATIVWDIDDREISDLLKPYGYQNAGVYLGGELVVSGRIYGIENTFSENGRKKILEGWSYTVDAVDSNVQPPYEEKKVTLEKRAETLLRPLGISVVFENIIDAPDPFDRVTANKDDKIFDHLLSLAKQRGVLISSTPAGEMLFTRAATLGKPLGTIIEDLVPGMSYNAKFDGRSRFNTYRAVGQTPRKKPLVAIATDTVVPPSRFLTISSDENTLANIKLTADWARSKQLAKALEIPFPVSSWYAPTGDLWSENSIVTVVSPTVGAPNGFNFLIRRVEYKFSREGTTAVLGLVPPQAFTDKELIEPWL
jgi:prophage tail gpP-like protein